MQDETKWLTLTEIEERAALNPADQIMQQLRAAMRHNKLLLDICTDPRFEIQPGDRIICGKSVCTVRKVEGDRAWFDGLHLGESSHEALTIGWCKRTAAARIVRRDGMAFHIPAAFGDKLTAEDVSRMTGREEWR